ncbi:glycoside hydrolase family 25 protein [Rufibacter psychrotolerans]|uniref:glycoside hydrolase family 25 protein n=1 Tax=Rufibacter psychrotolerans TaxID=2812556 RepID=UPI0019672FF2|nr:GH25 family lysozyme [Rufibacter sp. SYSU D00308]
MAVVLSCCLLLGSANSGPSFLHGIDVSRYQKEVNWEQVKDSNVHFAFIKATEGDFHKDPYFDRNWEQARQQGVKRGAYHFYLPWVDVEKQLEHFKSAVTLEPGDLAPVLDIETFAPDIPDAQLRSDIRRWLTAIEAHYGVRPILYTHQMYYNSKLRGYFPEYPFWIARYQNAEPTTHTKDKMAFWQYSEKGVVDGIATPVDVNWFYGDVQALNTFCVPALPVSTGTMAQNE